MKQHSSGCGWCSGPGFHPLKHGTLYQLFDIYFMFDEVSPQVPLFFFCITNFVESVALTCCCRSDLALSSSYCEIHSWTAIDLTSIGTQCFQHNLANILITLCFSVLHCMFGMITCLHFFADDSNRHINKYMNKMLRLSYFVKFSSSAPPALFTADILSHRRSFPGVTYHINNGSVVSKCASLS